MKPKVFLDTNILLDLILERPGYQDAARLLQAGEERAIELYCSFLTMANLAFILRKAATPALMVPTLMQIQSFIKVLPMDEDLLARTYGIRGRDFEDILQAVCASRGGCTHIVTRNTSDFRFSFPEGFPGSPESFPKVCTPEEFLAGNRNDKETVG